MEMLQSFEDPCRTVYFDFSWQMILEEVTSKCKPMFFLDASNTNCCNYINSTAMFISPLKFCRST